MRGRHDSDQIANWIKQDDMRMEVLNMASTLNLPDWCVAAGFVRNLVWDKLHDKSQPTPLSDIDLVYFDPDNISTKSDIRYEQHLKSLSDLPWSVKNQAHMHAKNKDAPYKSTSDAMSYWVEVEAAVGARISKSGDIELVAPFGLDALFLKRITLNRKRPKPEAFEQRIKNKQWLEIWPELTVIP